MRPREPTALVVAGRVIMGFGSTVIETCTSKILAHWFQHKGLGLVYGLDLSIGKLIVLTAKATAVPMRDATSFWGWALWIPAIAGVVGGFSGLNADIIKETRGSTAQLAGYTSAVQQVIPVICAPLIGSYFDFFGHRMVFVTRTGTRIRNLEVFNNAGSVIVDMIAGRLQDITPGGTYERVIAFFVAVKRLEFCLGLFYGILDRKYLSGILSINNKKRMKLEKEGKLEDCVGRKPSKGYTTAGIGLVCSLIIIAWVLFIKYSI
ncbi:hypothetical protein BDP81DRAFT_475555 [Colletotrichum phormii]|uniref:Major facilitator superfamily (MFS) profile domain-containing protein n=1 Tax=Colletotrichum phormii TaxID=359342 RepID=A0AAI9ZFE6_9PEZI|nr:uncharacterized protein BDP81DRAFT_475555 [Colletotrichum phormii]KAK1623558.1 hypothetical protein BDP81DRAFT_475555 [Colletotrichum phormii]